jgi:hypothetical protein
MGTAIWLTGSERVSTSGGRWTAGRCLLIALMIVGTLTAGASMASAKGNETAQDSDRSATRTTSSRSAAHGATAMGISVPLPPPS